MSRPIAPYAVQRAGTQGAWLPGWFGIDRVTDHSAWFATWAEAHAFINRFVIIDQRRRAWGMVPRWDGIDISEVTEACS